jgi:hypothetical protein
MDSDLGDALFESRPHTAYPKFTVSSLSLSSQIPRKLHRLGRDNFFPILYTTSLICRSTIYILTKKNSMV